MFHLTQLLTMADSESLNPVPIPSGVEVRRIRNSASVSTTDLAAAVGVTNRTIENYEIGRTSMIASSAAKLRLGRILAALAA